MSHVSPNNGVFLCVQCQMQHEKIGLGMSVVKSLANDVFTPVDVVLLALGGNRKFRTFMNFYDLNVAPILEKYKTVAADYYREKVSLSSSPASHSFLLWRREDSTPHPHRRSPKDGSASTTPQPSSSLALEPTAEPRTVAEVSQSFA